MTMDIPPYISVALLNQQREEQSSPNKVSKLKHTETSTITIVPKKRSFDVAFLISNDEPNRKSPETIRSAFKKVGLSHFSDSRTPSPNRSTPSPKSDEKVPKTTHDVYSFTNYRPKETILPASTFLNPAGISRSTFLPTPIFGPQILPTGFVTASFLPPSLAALSLPAQNVCAKCNVSFRMTSDLVYHMRSHHKNDHASVDHLRRKRELDKLKCPVCNESFRERHHLTRHMTAHQDKEGDHVKEEKCPLKFCDATRVTQ